MTIFNCSDVKLGPRFEQFDSQFEFLRHAHHETVHCIGLYRSFSVGGASAGRLYGLQSFGQAHREPSQGNVIVRATPPPQEMRKYRRLHVRRRVCRRRVAMLLYFFCGKRKKKWRIKHSGFWDNFRGCTVCNWTRPTSTNPTGVRPLNAPPILTGPFGNLVGECGSRFNPSGVSFKPPMGVAYVNYGHPHWLRRFQTRQNITHAHCTT